MVKNIIIRGVLGALIGLFISITIIVIISILKGELSIVNESNNVSSLSGFIIVYFTSLILGFVSGASSLIFETEKSLMFQTISHFILLNIVYWPIAIINSWIIISFINILVHTLIFIIIYLFIWFGFKTYWTKRVEEINSKIIKYNN